MAIGGCILEYRRRPVLLLLPDRIRYGRRVYRHLYVSFWRTASAHAYSTAMTGLKEGSGIAMFLMCSQSKSRALADDRHYAFISNDCEPILTTFNDK